MPWKPARPLITDAGKVELTDDEFEAINQWFESHKQWIDRHKGTPRSKRMPEEVIADVLGRLLGHAVGTMSPRPETAPPAPCFGDDVKE